MMRNRRRQRGGLGLVFLFMQLAHFGFNHIPPTTLITIALNVAIYLKVLNKFIYHFIVSPSIKNICVSTLAVWYKSEWSRLFLAAWFHLDDWHLYYNMVSFLWKGRTLEQRFGSFYFAYVIAVFSVLTNIVMVIINFLAAEIFQDYTYIVSCAAGFSGVIFALKVMSTHYMPSHRQSIMGIFSVPSHLACWVELVLIQVLVPRTSFTGHLAGILVGLAYTRGPLKSIMNFVAGIVGNIGNSVQLNYRQSTAHHARGQTTGGQTFWEERYTSGISEEEQMAAAMRQSRTDYGNTSPTAPPFEEDRFRSPTLPAHEQSGDQSEGPHARTELSREDLRNRRLERLGQ